MFCWCYFLVVQSWYIHPFNYIFFREIHSLRNISRLYQRKYCYIEYIYVDSFQTYINNFFIKQMLENWMNASNNLLLPIKDRWNINLAKVLNFESSHKYRFRRSNLWRMYRLWFFEYLFRIITAISFSRSYIVVITQRICINVKFKFFANRIFLQNLLIIL